MRKMFTVTELHERGLTRAAIRWGARCGRWRLIIRSVYGEGDAAPTDMERAVAAVIATGGVASGSLAGTFHRLDGVEFAGLDVTLDAGRSNARGRVRRRSLPADRIVTVDDVRCTDMLQTLLDLAAELDDDNLEQALESVLRRGGATTATIEAAATGTAGASRIRRVLDRRGRDAEPTGSLLETAAVQLARLVPGLPPPVRQYVVRNAHGDFVAKVDLCWPELGLFIELDGQWHEGQPVYDARRETAVVAATGWLVGRFTWHEIVHLPVTSARRLAQLVDQSRRRPLPA